MKDILAFPSTHPDLSYMGMTLRDYFAAKAMQGLVSAGPWIVPPITIDDTSALAYRMADAMLKAREA